MLQGQILNAAVTGNQGVILGDDGLRYTFTPREWRNNSVKAVAGMRVEYTAQGNFATDVRVTQAAPHTASSLHASVNVTAPSNPVAPSRAPSTPSTNSTLAASVSARPSYPRGASLKKKSHKFVTPTLEQKDKNAFALLLFLGNFGAAIGAFNIQCRNRVYILIVAIVAAIMFPIYLLSWPIAVLVGIFWLFASQETFDKHVHKRRYHTGLTRKHCLTGECSE